VGKPSLNAAQPCAKAEGRVFLLVPAYPGCPGTKAIKRWLLLFWISGFPTRFTISSCMSATGLWPAGNFVCIESWLQTSSIYLDMSHSWWHRFAAGFWPVCNTCLWHTFKSRPGSQLARIIDSGPIRAVQAVFYCLECTCINVVNMMDPNGILSFVINCRDWWLEYTDVTSFFSCCSIITYMLLFATLHVSSVCLGIASPLYCVIF